MGRGVENLRGKTTKVGRGQHLLFTVQILREARLKGAIYFWQCVDGVGHFLLTFFFHSLQYQTHSFLAGWFKGAIFWHAEPGKTCAPSSLPPTNNGQSLTYTVFLKETRL